MAPTYDWIIVGGGSAGATLASRLTEDGAASVLLLEAGADYSVAETPDAFFSVDPYHALVAGAEGGNLWLQLQARRHPSQEARLYAQGRGVGGSSTINGELAIRAPAEDHDGWSRRGCEGWSFADVLPYYRKLERDLDHGDADYHGDSGPVPVMRNPVDRWSDLERGLLDAALGCGYGWAPDHNAPGAAGASPYAFNGADGRRVSTNTGYLEPARERGNLTIRGGTFVERILFDGDRATGVVVAGPAGSETINGGEILLCAGAAHTPALLQRSGVGPADWLQPLGVPVIADLPVGRSLQDHALVITPVQLASPSDLTAAARHANLCIRFDSGLPGAEPKDLMIVCINHVFPNPNMGLVGVWLNRVRSRGSVRIVSTDPTAEPEIDECMLVDEEDRRVMREGIQRLREIVDRPEAANALSAPVALPTVEEALAVVTDTQHLSCTCPMGAEGDPRAVVDSDCRVRGLRNLRVIDASVFPDVPRSNTNLPTIMTAELMADRLRG